MNAIEEAIQICNQAEQALRELLKKTVSAGDYAAVPAVAQMAEQVKRLADAAPGTASAISTHHPTSGSSTPSGGAGTTTRGSRSSRRKPSRSKGSLRSAKTGYPKFHRRGDSLVKTGWSKKSRSEYEHRAPKSAIDALVEAILATAQKTEVFTAEAFMPLVASGDSIEIPSYQLYLALAWLRAQGLVHQHGREGYSVSDQGSLLEAVNERWAALKSQQARRS